MWPFNQKQYPTLAKAVNNHDLRAVREMLKKGADPNSFDQEYEIYVIHRAVGMLSWETVDYNETVEIIKLLVDHGANINMPLGGRMPLWIAEAGHHAEVAAVLRKAGARLRADDDRGILAPAKEREIRKVARDFARQIGLISPNFTKEQLAEAIESKIIIQPDSQSTADAYARFKGDIRSIIRDVVGLH